MLNRQKDRIRSLVRELRKKLESFCGKHSGICWSWLKRVDWRNPASFALFAKPGQGERPQLLDFQRGMVTRLIAHISIALKVRLVPHKESSADWMAYNVVLP